jgi:hypothetical protein
MAQGAAILTCRDAQEKPNGLPLFDLTRFDYAGHPSITKRESYLPSWTAGRRFEKAAQARCFPLAGGNPAPYLQRFTLVGLGRCKRFPGMVVPADWFRTSNTKVAGSNPTGRAQHNWR